MSRLLTDAVLSAEPRRLRRPEPALDPTMVAVVEEAYERGVREGAVAGRAAAEEGARESARVALAALQGALAQAVSEMRAARDHEARATIALATEIARVVVGREPGDEGVALLARVQAALCELDDPQLVVYAAPADVDVLADGLRELPNVAVQPDAALAPGDARIAGGWALADLTRETAWSVVEAALQS